MPYDEMMALTCTNNRALASLLTHILVYPTLLVLMVSSREKDQEALATMSRNIATIAPIAATSFRRQVCWLVSVGERSCAIYVPRSLDVPFWWKRVRVERPRNMHMHLLKGMLLDANPYHHRTLKHVEVFRDR